MLSASNFNAKLQDSAIIKREPKSVLSDDGQKSLIEGVAAVAGATFQISLLKTEGEMNIRETISVADDVDSGFTWTEQPDPTHHVCRGFTQGAPQLKQILMRRLRKSTGYNESVYSTHLDYTNFKTISKTDNSVSNPTSIVWRENALAIIQARDSLLRLMNHDYSDHSLEAYSIVHEIQAAKDALKLKLPGWCDLYCSDVAQLINRAYTKFRLNGLDFSSQHVPDLKPTDTMIALYYQMKDYVSDSDVPSPDDLTTEKFAEHMKTLLIRTALHRTGSQAEAKQRLYVLTGTHDVDHVYEGLIQTYNFLRIYNSHRDGPTRVFMMLSEVNELDEDMKMMLSKLLNEGNDEAAVSSICKQFLETAKCRLEKEEFELWWRLNAPNVRSFIELERSRRSWTSPLQTTATTRSSLSPLETTQTETFSMSPPQTTATTMQTATERSRIAYQNNRLALAKRESEIAYKNNTLALRRCAAEIAYKNNTLALRRCAAESSMSPQQTTAATTQTATERSPVWELKEPLEHGMSPGTRPKKSFLAQYTKARAGSCRAL